VLDLATYLTGTNPEAMHELKRIFWDGTEHWDELLDQRAAMSGTLVLSEQTRAMLAKYA
jgi:methylglutaconyl-CoA hydratase